MSRINKLIIIIIICLVLLSVCYYTYFSPPVGAKEVEIIEFSYQTKKDITEIRKNMELLNANLEKILKELKRINTNPDNRQEN